MASTHPTKQTANNMPSPEERVLTSFGIHGVDRSLSGGIASNSTIMIIGDIGSGKSTFAQQFVYEGLLRGHYALYTTTDEPAANIRKNMIGLGIGVSIYEQKGRLALVDACGGQSGDEQYNISDPSKLSSLERVEVRLLRRYHQEIESGEGGEIRIVMDSVTRLGLRTSDADLIDFILRRIRKCRSRGLLALDIYAKNAHSKEFITTVSNGYDIILQLESKSDPIGGVSYLFRVVKARQFQYDRMAYEYYIEPKVGAIIQHQGKTIA